MKITLSRDEIKSIVAQHYGLNADFFLEISSERSSVPDRHRDMPAAASTVITVNSNNQVVDVKSTTAEEATDKKEVTEEKKIEPSLFSICQVCGKKFISKNSNTKTCSRSCRSKLIYQGRKDRGLPAPVKNSVDYQKYGLIIEDFLNSSDSIRPIDDEGLTADGILYRYRRASKIFNFDDKVKFSREAKQLKMVKEY